MKKARGHFNFLLRPEPEGGFTIIVPALPGCVTHGRTLAEAKKMARDAISGYSKSLKKRNQPIPANISRPTGGGQLDPISRQPLK
jgi:antitoxin HicB